MTLCARLKRWEWMRFRLPVIWPMPMGVRRLVQAAKDRFGRCDLLVNNAGMAPTVRADLLEAGVDSFRRVMQVNLEGPYFLTQAIANWMIEQRSQWPDRAMRIVNMGSISAFTSSTNRGEYCLSKAAMGMMTALYADRLAEYDIGVFEIRPGIIATDMTSGVKEKYDRLIAEGTDTDSTVGGG